MIVVDTCIIVHLFNQTPFTKLAQEVLERDASWIIPPIWQEEYANVLSKLAKKEKRKLSDVISHFKTTLEQLSLCERPVDIVSALETSIQSKISVYDAHFVTLAREYTTKLITEDKEILDNCPNEALSMREYLSS